MPQFKEGTNIFQSVNSYISFSAAEQCKFVFRSLCRLLVPICFREDMMQRNQSIIWSLGPEETTLVRMRLERT
jgi:hypothetical protein